MDVLIRCPLKINFYFVCHGCLKDSFKTLLRLFFFVRFLKMYKICHMFPGIYYKYQSISCLNPLSANGELSRHENLTLLWTWILRQVPRSFATHASLCNNLSSNKLCPKTVKILALKGLKEPLEKVCLQNSSNSRGLERSDCI